MTDATGQRKVAARAVEGAELVLVRRAGDRRHEAQSAVATIDQACDGAGNDLPRCAVVGVREGVRDCLQPA